MRHIHASEGKQEASHRHGDAAAEDEAWGPRPSEGARSGAQRGDSAPQHCRRGGWHSCCVLADKGFEGIEMNVEGAVVVDGRNLAQNQGDRPAQKKM